MLPWLWIRKVRERHFWDGIPPWQDVDLEVYLTSMLEGLGITTLPILADGLPLLVADLNDRVEMDDAADLLRQTRADTSQAA
jgi:hypothetical protein